MSYSRLFIDGATVCKLKTSRVEEVFNFSFTSVKSSLAHGDGSETTTTMIHTKIALSSFEQRERIKQVVAIEPAVHT